MFIYLIIFPPFFDASIDIIAPYFIYEVFQENVYNY